LSVKRKFFDEICSDKKDTLFFMGTVFPYNTWVVLGVFWPPKQSSEIASLTVCIEINQFIPKIQRSFSILILGAKLFQAVSPLRQPGLGQSQFRRRYP
jgi:hypothetical protein